MEHIVLFKNLTIQDKLKSILVINALCALFFLAAAFLIYQIFTYEKQTSRLIEANADILSITVSQALKDNNQTIIDDVIQSFGSRLNISSILVVNTQGQVVNRYYQHHSIKEKLNPLSWEDTTQLAQQLNHHQDAPKLTPYGFHAHKPLRLNGENLGQIHLFMEHKPFYQVAFDYLLICSVFLLFAALLAVGLAYKLQKMFTVPIIKLKNTITQITTSNEYDLSVEIDQHDELGQLAEAFNKMLDEIQSRNDKIRAHKQKLEQEVRNRTQELCIANEKLSKIIKKSEFEREKAVQASYTKSMFVANMSHEIRTPLNGVLGMMEILKKTKLDAQQIEYLQIAQSSADTLLHIINDILDFSKIEADQLVLEEAPINIRNIVEQTCLQFMERAHSKGIEIIINLPPDIHPFYLGDELRIKQILMNLISNAIKFTEVGNITISITEQISDPDNKAYELKFVVADTGCGIDCKNPNKIFESFSQADDSTSRMFGGTGLGLSICKRLIELMDGEIDVKSTPKVGTEFHFTIKLLPHEQKTNISHEKLQFDSLKALIVDDVEINGNILSSQLNTWQIQCHYVTNGQDALAFLEGNPDYELLITDYHMPNMNGIQLIHNIRSKDKLKHIDVILLSSFSTPLSAKESASLNIKAHLNKPINQEKLFEAIANIYNKSEPTPQPTLPIEEEQADYDQSFYGKRVMVAEDNAVNQGLAKIILENFGCHVTICHNGKEAFEQYKTAKFDVVLMDCQMPYVDGYEATRKIRTFEHTLHRYTPIIALTANVTKEDKEKCKQCGMDDYLSKPYSEKELFDVLAKFLKPQGKEEPSNQAKVAHSVPMPTDSSAILVDQAIINKLKSLDKPGKPSTLRKLISLYLESMDEKLPALEKELEKQDMHEVHQIAHMLKSSSASIGVTTIATNLKELEKEAKEKNLDKSVLLYSQLQEYYLQARPILHSIMEALPS